MSYQPLRVAVVGVGLMGADHATRLSARIANAVLVAVADPDEARARELASGFNGVTAYADAFELIRADEVDAVLLASPGLVHEEQLLACIDAGKYVMCEKPLTMDVQSSLRVLQAERASGTQRIQVGFMRRFDPEYARMQAILASGDLGRTLVMHNTHRNKDVPDSFRSEMIVRDSLVHEVDVARFMFGEEITEITVLSPKPTSAAAPGVADPQVSIFRMAGGAIVTNEVFVKSQVGYEVRCEGVCERGTVIAGRNWGDLYSTAAGAGDGRWGGSIPLDFRVRFEAAYDREIQAWVDATRRGEVVGATAWDGYAATAVCSAGMESLASGQAVSVALVDRESLT